MKCPQHNIKELINNRNTGIEYEYGVALSLMTGEQFTDFFTHVVNKHPNKNTIIDICKSVAYAIAPITGNINYKEGRYISLAPTQDDSLGPSDILFCCNGKIEFGISVKYGNINNWNPSAKWFINEAVIKNLKRAYTEAKPKYIKEMRSIHGRCEEVKGSKNTWSRKKSEVTNTFIDQIRNEIIKSWDLKSETEKQKIINSGYQLFSPIDYYVVNIKRKNNKYECKLSDPKPVLFSVQNIELKKYDHSAQYVYFEVDGKVVVKLQVKFNNGFLTKDPLITRNSFQIDDINFKDGDPFGSYNFNIL